MDLSVDHVVEAMDYARRVVAREIPACKWALAACQRQLDDLDRADTDPDYPFRFSYQHAARAIAFVQLLRHVKGELAGQPLLLHPSQKFSIACVFGWLRKSDGMRRFRTVYEEVPRKNAKTTKLAGIGLYLLTADGEEGAEVYSAATTRDQARIVWQIAKNMARRDGLFRARFGVDVRAHSLNTDDGSIFLPLSAEGSTLDGLNVSGALVDELHAHKTREVYDVLDSGAGARRQPLIWSITTAGSNFAGVCYDLRTYLTKVLNATLHRHGGLGYKVEGQAVEDDYTWGTIYTIDDGDDPMDEAVWAKANPLYGVSVFPEDMRRMAAKARTQTAALSNFLTKRLNVWVNASVAWMDMSRWRAHADPALKLDQFTGRTCWIGLDAAFRQDFFAKVYVFHDPAAHRWTCFCRAYAPRALVEREGWEQVRAWADAGWIVTTPGNVLDIDIVRDELDADISRFQIAECAYDPAQLTDFAVKARRDLGVNMVELRPTVSNFSEPMKRVEEFTKRAEGEEGDTLWHDGNPVLEWMISNVVCHVDVKENIYPRKGDRDKKIDGAIALIMALGRALATGGAEVDFGLG